MNRLRAAENQAMRLIAGADNELALLMDGLNDEDLTFEVDGEVVLIVDPELSQHLDGRTLDISSDADEAWILSGPS
ncbi:MAG: hypothetical protein ACE5HV_13985 [Acidobacteriota bacterium]